MFAGSEGEIDVPDHFISFIFEDDEHVTADLSLVVVVFLFLLGGNVEGSCPLLLTDPWVFLVVADRDGA